MIHWHSDFSTIRFVILATKSLFLSQVSLSRYQPTVAKASVIKNSMQGHKLLPHQQRYLSAIPCPRKMLLKLLLLNQYSLFQIIRLTKNTFDFSAAKKFLSKSEQNSLRNYCARLQPSEYLYLPGFGRTRALEAVLFHLDKINQPIPKFGSKHSTPTALVMGYPRCGTTWFYEMVKKTACYGVSKKEIEYFGSYRYVYGDGWYGLHFSNSGHPSLDVSVNYMSDPEIWLRIKKYQTKHHLNLKKIIFVRSPLSRAISYLNYRRAKGEGYYRYSRYLQSGYVSHLFITSSEYQKHLSQLIRIFDPKYFLVVFQEHLDQNPMKVFKQICRFLGNRLPQRYAQADAENFSKRYNKSYRVRFFPPLKLAYDLEAWLKLFKLRPLDYLGQFFRLCAQFICLTANRNSHDQIQAALQTNPTLSKLEQEYSLLPAWLKAHQVKQTRL